MRTTERRPPQRGRCGAMSVGGRHGDGGRREAEERKEGRKGGRVEGRAERRRAAAERRTRSDERH